MANQFPIYNDIAPSWADVSVKMTGTDIVLLEMEDIAAINLARTVEVGEQKSGGRVIKTTSGDVTNEASLTLYRSGHVRFLETLSNAAIAKGLVRGPEVAITLVHFDIQVRHTPIGSNQIFDRRARGCRVLSDALNGTEGTDPDKVEVGLHCKRIFDMINGKEVVLR